MAVLGRGPGQPRGIGQGLFGIGLVVPPVPPPPPPIYPRVLLWLSAVLATWQPVDPQPQLRTLRVPPTEPNAPSVYVPEIVWFDDAPLPQSPARIAAIIPAASQQAYTKPWLDPTLAAWQLPFALPQPGPLTPRSGGDRVVPRQVWLDPIIAGWQVNPDTRPQPPSHTPQNGGDRVVPRLMWLDALVNGWQVNPDTRPQPPVRTPQGGGDRVPADRKWLSPVVLAWAPPDPLPTLPARTPQGGGDRVVPSKAWLDPVLGGWQVNPDTRPQPPVHTPQSGGDLIPEGRRWLPTALAAWVPPTPAAQTELQVVPSTVVVQVQYPPSNVAWLANVILSWQPLEFRPQTSPFTAQKFPDQPPPVDIPHIVWFDDAPLPQTRAPIAALVPQTVQQAFTRQWLDPTVLAWQPLDIRPQRGSLFVPPGGSDIVPAVGVPVFGMVETWRYPRAVAPIAALLSPSTPPPIGIQPPPWQSQMWWMWQPPAPLPQVQAHLAPIPPPPIVTSTAKFLLIMGVGT